MRMWRECALEPIVSASSDSLIKGLSALKGYFKDFKPVLKSIVINYSKRTSTIGFVLRIDEGFRKEHNKIKIPAYGRFTVSRMQDAAFNELKFQWELKDGQWILDAKKLRPSDGYFIELEGKVDEQAVKDIIHIKQAVNRDSDDQYDKYWLYSSIKNPALLERIWTELQIDDVSIGVSVDFNKLFSLQMPPEIAAKADAMSNFLRVGATSSDRGVMFRAWRDFKQQERKIPFQPGSFLQLVQDLTSRATLLEYFTVDSNRYQIGDIEQPTKFQGVLPQDIKVHAATTLTLREPKSTGHLIFQRQKYIDRLKKEFDDLRKQP